jgi:hypothetical protein
MSKKDDPRQGDSTSNRPDGVSLGSKLIGNEFDLARAELSEKANQASRAAAIIGAGAVFLIPELVIVDGNWAVTFDPDFGLSSRRNRFE